MAYSRQLADRVGIRLANYDGLEIKKMFGGIGYMLHGNLAIGVYKESLIVRVGAEDYLELLAEPVAREFDISGRAMKGWIMIDVAGLNSDDSLEFWIKKGVDFALRLPPK